MVKVADAKAITVRLWGVVPAEVVSRNAIFVGHPIMLASQAGNRALRGIMVIHFPLSISSSRAVISLSAPVGSALFLAARTASLIGSHPCGK